MNEGSLLFSNRARGSSSASRKTTSMISSTRLTSHGLEALCIPIVEEFAELWLQLVAVAAVVTILPRLLHVRIGRPWPPNRFRAILTKRFLPESTAGSWVGDGGISACGNHKNPKKSRGSSETALSPDR
ncbi:uncharacterized protein FFUJ_14180 [Fusarium fujikuroi IMI 58289]|uniref:Uncharacterized protein n=1 Tax=Gibberella fujikuroi (strain CBS 195.34 / IMI 58289 / NRRL A-6831) TaxID=1279085 RepID=S0ENA9_GIBF5|nr:uncharacterized protein FFUJ_14180 [Fusarium fujikuroi IMI 58289]CCT76187.1 uncharacterized protein FFUJ_14180 [Fusarium fujikuroi IMI 58289]SCO26791.1 uncharacterized protein FFM5_15060 [Fusarium fujikuroi]